MKINYAFVGNQRPCDPARKITKQGQKDYSSNQREHYKYNSFSLQAQQCNTDSDDFIVC